MKTKIILKNPAPNGMKEFEYNEQAIFDDADGGFAVFACGEVSGGRIGNTAYSFKDRMHIVYDWDDIERVEITK